MNALKLSTPRAPVSTESQARFPPGPKTTPNREWLVCMNNCLTPLKISRNFKTQSPNEPSLSNTSYFRLNFDPAHLIWRGAGDARRIVIWPLAPRLSDLLHHRTLQQPSPPSDKRVVGTRLAPALSVFPWALVEVLRLAAGLIPGVEASEAN